MLHSSMSLTSDGIHCTLLCAQVGPVVRSLGSFETATDVEEIHSVIEQWTMFLATKPKKVCTSKAPTAHESNRGKEGVSKDASFLYIMST